MLLHPLSIYIYRNRLYIQTQREKEQLNCRDLLPIKIGKISLQIEYIYDAFCIRWIWKQSSWALSCTLPNAITSCATLWRDDASGLVGTSERVRIRILPTLLPNCKINKTHYTLDLDLSQSEMSAKVLSGRKSCGDLWCLRFLSFIYFFYLVWRQTHFGDNHNVQSA